MRGLDEYVGWERQHGAHHVHDVRGTAVEAAVRAVVFVVFVGVLPASPFVGLGGLQVDGPDRGALTKPALLTLAPTLSAQCRAVLAWGKRPERA